jgi:hypothetical protein
VVLSVTCEPPGKLLAHVPLAEPATMAQLMPAGLLVIDPLPVPAPKTVTEKLLGVGVGVGAGVGVGFGFFMLLPVPANGIDPVAVPDRFKAPWSQPAIRGVKVTRIVRERASLHSHYSARNHQTR